MSWGWLIAAGIVGLLSVVCVVSTTFEIAVGKKAFRTEDYWGAVVFHGASAVLALWLLSRAIGPV